MNTKLFGAVISITGAIIVCLLGIFMLAYGLTLMPSWIKLIFVGAVIVYLCVNYIIGTLNMITKCKAKSNN